MSVFHQGFRRPHGACLFVLEVGIVLSLILSGGVTRSAGATPRSPRPPAKGSCYPKTKPTYEEIASASPDLGGIDPTVLVAVGTTVQLTGISDKYIVLADCTLDDTPVPFTWSLSFQAQGGSGQQVLMTGQLQNPTTLMPAFTASQLGEYVAQIHGGGQIGTVRIQSVSRGLGWVSIGPNGSVDSQDHGYTSVGRVNDIAFDPTASSTLYAASALGGVWKSFSSGADWFPVTDHKGLPTLAFGAVAVGPDGAVYAGTGDLHHNDDGLWEDGAGLWRSHDGGQTWQPAGNALSEGCPQGDVPFLGTASRIVVDPQNPSIIFVAARPSTGKNVNTTGSGGLFRSTDGGDCWQSLGTFADVTDITLIPSSPTTLYVGALRPGPGIFKTSDALDTAPMFVPQTLPIAAKAYTYIVITSAPSNARDIYAVLSTANTTDFVRSVNAGAAWQLAAHPAPLGCGGLGQCDYGTALAVSPVNPYRVFYGEVNTWQSTDGMASWTGIGAGHSDHHALVFAPNDPTALYAANDGGVFRLAIPADITRPKPTQGWQPRNLDLAIAQAPEVAADPNSPQGAALGAWDNGSQRRLVGRTWDEFRGGDGFNATIDAAAGPETIYFNWNALYGGDFGRYPSGTDLGAANNYVSNPYRPGELFGIQANNLPSLYVTENANTAGTASWRCADAAPAGGASAWSVEFAVDGSYFEGMTDGSLYHFTLPDPQTIQAMQGIGACAANATAAQNVTQVLAPVTSGQPTPPRLAADPFDAQSIYVMRPGDTGAARVMKLTFNGANWSPTSLAGIPGDPNALPASVNVNTMWSAGADPSAKGTVYVGTTHGLWEGSPLPTGGYGWSLDLDVPDTWIMEFSPQRNTKGYGGVLLLTTYGRGVWERFKTSVGCHVSCIPLSGGSPFCLTCISGAQSTDASGQSAMPDDAAWLTIPYSYRGEAGPQAVLHVTPLIAGADTQYFASDDQTVTVGDGVRDVRVRYATTSTPLGARTDGFLIELLPVGGGEPLASSTIPYAHWWARPEARLLTISAQVIDPGPWPVRTPLSLTVGRSPVIQVTMPVTIPVPQSATVTLAVPARVAINEDTQQFVGWSGDGTLLGSRPSISVTVAADVSVLAQYGTSVAVAPGHPPSGPPASNRPPLLALGIAVTVVVAALGMIFALIWRQRRSKRVAR